MKQALSILWIIPMAIALLIAGLGHAVTAYVINSDTLLAALDSSSSYEAAIVHVLPEVIEEAGVPVSAAEQVQSIFSAQWLQMGIEEIVPGIMALLDDPNAEVLDSDIRFSIAEPKQLYLAAVNEELAAIEGLQELGAVQVIADLFNELHTAIPDEVLLTRLLFQEDLYAEEGEGSLFSSLDTIDDPLTKADSELIGDNEIIGGVQQVQTALTGIRLVRNVSAAVLLILVIALALLWYKNVQLGARWVGAGLAAAGIIVVALTAGGYALLRSAIQTGNWRTELSPQLEILLTNSATAYIEGALWYLLAPGCIAIGIGGVLVGVSALLKHTYKEKAQSLRNFYLDW